MAIKHSSVTKDQVLQGTFPQRQAQPRGFSFKTIIHCSGNSQQQEQGVQDCQPHAFTRVSSDQLHKTHVFGQVFSAPVGSPERQCPRRLLASQILRNSNIIKILRKNICLLLPQSATTKILPLPISHSSKTVDVFYFNAILYLTVKCTKPLVFFVPANTFSEMLVYIPGHSQSKDCEKACQYLLAQAQGDFSFFTEKPQLISGEFDELAAAGTG